MMLYFIYIPQIFGTFLNSFHVISAFKKSSQHASNFTISKSMLPSNFMSSLHFSCIFELYITFDKDLTLNDAFDIFYFHSSNVIKVIPYFSSTVSNYNFSNSTALLPLFPLNSKTIDSKIQNSLFFMVTFDRSANLSNFFHFSFSENDVQNLPPKTSEILISSNAFSTDKADLFTIILDSSATMSSAFRNLVCLDRRLLEVEKQRLFTGVASLKQSFYMYMEPAGTKVLSNRSDFNFFSAVNGDPRSSLNSLYSTFSEETGHTEWLLASNRNEYLTIKTPLLNRRNAATISIMINMDIYLHSDKTSYLKRMNDRMIPLLSIYDSQDDRFLLIEFYSLYDENNPNMIELHFHIEDNSSSKIYDLVFDEEPIDFATFQLSPVNLLMSFIHSGQDNLNLLIEIDRGTSKHVKMVDKTLTFPASSLDYILLGNKISQYYTNTSVVLINIFDVQIFEGGTFFSGTEDTNAILSASKGSPHIARCLSNPYPNRRSQNAQLDEIYWAQLAVVKTCSELEFNKNCIFPNCEICGKDSCLICRIPFVLEKDVCISNQAQMNDLTYDVFSRNQGFDNLSAKQTMTLVKNSTKSLGSPGQYVYGRLLFDVDFHDYAYYPVSFELNGGFHYFFNPNPLAKIFQDRFNFVSSNLAETFVLFKIDDPPVITVKRYKLAFEYVLVDNLCASHGLFLKSSLKISFCHDLAHDLTGRDYLGSEIELASDYQLEPNSFMSNLSIFGLTLNLILDCANNCDCGNSDDQYSCSSCPAGFSPVVLDEYSQSCEPNSNSCFSACEQCFGQTCHKCSSFPYNHLLEFNPEDRIQIAGFYCAQCPVSCFACAGSSQCHCSYKSGFKFLAFVSKFNVCQFQACGNSCLECDGQGVCFRCKSSYFLIGKKCISVKSAFTRCAGLLSGKCIKCKPQYRLDSICLKCSSNCAECVSDPSQNFGLCTKCHSGYLLTPKLKCYKKPSKQPQKNLSLSLVCLSGHFLSPKTKKCVPCGLHCLECNWFECIRCRSPYFPLKKKFQLCQISNCVSCPESDSCLKCSSGHFYASASQQCLPCSTNCLACNSSTKCLLCKSSHVLFSEKHLTICVPICLPGYMYLDPVSKQCLNCSKCQSCQPKFGCSSCDSCKRRCEFTFVKVNKKQFSLSSVNVDFSKAKWSTESPEFQSALSANISGTRIIFGIKNAVDHVFRVRIDWSSLRSFDCSVQQDVYLELASVTSFSLLNSKTFRFLYSIGSNAKAIVLSLTFASSFFSYSNLMQMLIYISTSSSLFSYSFVFDSSDKTGFSGAISQLNRTSIILEKIKYPLDKKESFWGLYKLNGFYVNYVSINSFLLGLLVIFWVYYLAFSFPHKSKHEEKSKEWFQYFLARRMDRPFMKRFFRKLQRKTNSETCNHIVRFLRKTKRKINSGFCHKFFRKCKRFFQRKKFDFAFAIFSLFNQELAHLSAKSIRYYNLFHEHKVLIFYCFLFHFCLIGFLFALAMRVHELNRSLMDLVKHGRDSQLEEYFGYVRYLGIYLFSTWLVYFLILLSGRVSVEAFSIFCVLFALVLGTIEKKLFYFAQTFVMLKFSIVLVLIGTLLVNSDLKYTQNSIYSDVLFACLELFGMAISICTFVLKLNKKWKKKLKLA